MPFFNYSAKNKSLTFFKILLKKVRDKKIILALGPESAGNFSVYFSEKIFFSENFGDLLDEENYKNFQKSILNFLKINKIKPDIILTDLHPLYKTTTWGKELSQKFKAKHIQIQHHLAHIFSAIGEKTIIENCKLKIENYIGIACDGTGYGLDEKIWGGEIFKIKNVKIKNQNDNAKFKINKNQNLSINRIGHLENQILIGGDLAIKEPARILIAILAKIINYKLQIINKSQTQNSKSKINLKSKILNLKLQKDFIYSFVKKYYTCNQFELLYNQLQQNFNCQETSSTGRILDATSLLLGFCKNERNYKHEPIDLLEKNSTTPYNIKPKIIFDKKEKKYILSTTFLFEYLIKNLRKDKKRLAATAQLYIAQGLYKIIKKLKTKSHNLEAIFAGGIANNKIISNYLKSKGVYSNNLIPRGDAGLSFGQIIYYLLS